MPVEKTCFDLSHGYVDVAGKKVSDRSKVYFMDGFVICINTLTSTQKQMGFTVTKMDLLKDWPE